MSTDRTNAYIRGTGAAVEDSWDVTPSDTTNLPQIASFIYVGTSGDLAYLPPGTDTNPHILRNLAAGVFHRIRARRILATGTTATQIVAGD